MLGILTWFVTWRFDFIWLGLASLVLNFNFSFFMLFLFDPDNKLKVGVGNQIGHLLGIRDPYLNVRITFFSVNCTSLLWLSPLYRRRLFMCHLSCLRLDYPLQLFPLCILARIFLGEATWYDGIGGSSAPPFKWAPPSLFLKLVALPLFPLFSRRKNGSLQHPFFP